MIFQFNIGKTGCQIGGGNQRAYHKSKIFTDYHSKCSTECIYTIALPNFLISGIHIGTNGYIVVKDAEGTIIMHPKKEQWGIPVIAGRKKMYPDLDYSSLEKMIEDQKKRQEGISHYYSYWWTNEERPRVQKISAYSPVQIGDSFWVVSAVIDYDDLYEPLAESFLKMVCIFVGILLAAGIAVVLFGRVMRDMRRAVREINDLKELNEQLEKMHRSEQSIAHQQRLQIMGTMIGGIAHEFNNFLTPIMGYAELLMMELPEGSEEQDSAKEIHDACRKDDGICLHASDPYGK